jgi:alkaline phosphatase D
MLFLLACTRSPDPIIKNTPTPEDSAVRLQDADADGVTEDLDCDDTNPEIAPGIPEICDGVDQDCDGIADQGIPTDGAGCQDPGWPEFPEIVDIVQLVLATATDAYASTDDPIEVCLSESWCVGLDVADWDDREEGQWDVYTFKEAGLLRSEITGFTLNSPDGGDRWQPTGFEVSLDGEAVYTRGELEIYIGSEGDELSSWTETLGIYSDTIWESPLTHGPILGATSEDGAKIWIRTDHTRQVALKVAETADGLSSAALVAWRYPRADRDFTEVFDVVGLGAGKTWFYSLVIDGVEHGPYSLTTAPSTSTHGIRTLAFGSCTKEDDQPIFGAIAADAPDVFLFVGDNHYGNTSELDSLRQWYRWAHSRELRDAVMQLSSTLATWDDHDYTGNNTDGTASGKENALQAFTEYWANDFYGLEGTEGVFSVHSYGDIDIFLVDDRYYRGLEDSITGAAQEAWLIEAVQSSTAVFKLVASGSQWNLDGSNDSWAAFPEAQSRVVDALSEVSGVVLLSGDIHSSEFVEVPAAGYTLPELTSSSMAYTSSNRYIFIEMDTSLADPSLLAQIKDEEGNVVEEWAMVLSELSP